MIFLISSIHSSLVMLKPPLQFISLSHNTLCQPQPYLFSSYTQAAIPFPIHFDTNLTLKLFTLHPDPVHPVDLPVLFTTVVVIIFGGLQQIILANTTSTITPNPIVVGIESTSFGNISWTHSLFMMIPPKFNLSAGLPICTCSFSRIFLSILFLYYGIHTLSFWTDLSHLLVSRFSRFCPRSNVYSFSFTSGLLYYDSFLHDCPKYLSFFWP